MARIRSVKPGFFTSLDIACLSRDARLHFVGLWTYADDEGRGVDDPRLIKAAVWPLDDDITAEDVERLQDELTKHDRIVRYQVGGRRYFAVTGWHEHQKPNRPQGSKLPAPDQGVCAITDDAVSTHGARSDDALPEGRGEEGEKEGSGSSSRATRSDRATRLPDDWTPDDEPELYAEAKAAGVDLPREFARFGDYWRAKGGQAGRKVDWQATWRNWLRKAIDDRPRGNGARDGPSHVDRYRQAAEQARRREAGP